MKKIFKKEVVIGLCLIIALAILYFGIEYLKGRNLFHPANYYYAVYTDANGLPPSSPVNANGIKVGKVDRVEMMYDNPGHVIVEFSIDKRVKLPEGTKAVLTSSLLGTPSIKLDIAQGSAIYAPGDTIPGVAESGLMDKVSDNILPAVDSVVPKVDSLLVNLNNLTGNPALARSIDNLEAITQSMRSTMEVLNASATKIQPMMTEVNGIVANVNQISSDLTKLTNSLADAPVDSVMQNANRISAELADLSAKLNDPDGNLGKLLNGTELYDNLTRATADIDSLLVDIKKNPKRYISIKLL